MSGKIEAALQKLGALYEKTGKDWVLEVHHILTESTCPTVCIYPEGNDSTRYRFDRDTIEEGIAAAANAVYREVILGEKIEPECPFTNPGDHKDEPAP